MRWNNLAAKEIMINGPRDETNPIPAISISEALKLYQYDSSQVKVKGIISSRSRISQKIMRRFRCQRCGMESMVERSGSSSSTVLDLEPRIVNQYCNKCRSTRPFIRREEVFHNLQIELVDTNGINPNPLAATITKNILPEIKLSQVVIVNGTMQFLQIKKNQSNFVQKLIVQNIDYEKRNTLTNKIKAFENFRKNTGINTLHNLALMLNPNMVGIDNISECLLLCCANTSESTDTLSSFEQRIHLLIITRIPQVSKLLASTTDLVHYSRYENILATRGKKLIASVSVKDKIPFLRLGNLTLARGGLCIINSIQALTPIAKNNLRTIMNDGFIQIEEREISECLNNYATIIAVFEPSYTSSLKSSFFSSIRGKFDLVLDLSDAFEKELFHSNNRTTRITTFLTNYIAYARSFDPKITGDIKKVIADKYSDIVTQYGSNTILTQNLIQKLSLARSKLNLKNIVEENDVNETMELIMRLINSSQIADENTYESLKELTLNECITRLRELSKPTKFYDLIEDICQKNSTVRKYLGTELRIQSNSKLRNVYNHLIKSKQIIVISKKPIVIACNDKNN